MTGRREANGIPGLKPRAIVGDPVGVTKPRSVAPVTCLLDANGVTDNSTGFQPRDSEHVGYTFLNAVVISNVPSGSGTF